MVSQFNSAVLEIIYPHTLREIERDAERRRIMRELVHKPSPIRRELARLRTYLFLDAVSE